MSRLADARGMTIVEAAVAGLLLMIGALASLQVFDAGARNTYRAEESQVVSNRLQAELEQIRALPYEQIAMTMNPGSSADQNDPRSRISGVSFALARDTTNYRQMVLNGGMGANGEAITAGAVVPGPTPFEAGDVSGEIYRFVTWAPNPCTGCGTQFMKQVVVAASIDEAAVSFEHRFQEIHAQIADPEALPDDNPGPGDDDDDDTATAEFWLTDTPCNSSTRQPLVGHHVHHNTRGICSSGLKTGATPGAPDLMYPGPPALDANFPPASQPLYDYATDIEPAVNPANDRGTLLEKATTGGCLLSGGLVDLSLLELPLLESNKERKLHKWLSPPVPTNFEVLLLGRGTLELYTRSLNGVSHPGKICAWFFVRKLALNLLGIPIAVDVPVVNLEHPLQVSYFEYAQNPWPTTWTKISVPMHFLAPGTILPGERLGLAITVEKNATSGAQGLEFMYDHPDFESRLQVETDRILAFN